MHITVRLFDLASGQHFMIGFNAQIPFDWVLESLWRAMRLSAAARKHLPGPPTLRLDHFLGPAFAALARVDRLPVPNVWYAEELPWSTPVGAVMTHLDLATPDCERHRLLVIKACQAYFRYRDECFPAAPAAFAHFVPV